MIPIIIVEPATHIGIGEPRDLFEQLIVAPGAKTLIPNRCSSFLGNRVADRREGAYKRVRQRFLARPARLVYPRESNLMCSRFPRRSESWR